MSDRLVYVATFSNSVEANIALAALEAHGIRGCLDGEALAASLWHAGPTIAGVRLSVFEEQLDKAKQVLAEAGHGVEEEDQGIEPKEVFPDEDEPEEAGEVERQAHIRRAWFAAVIGLITCPLFFNAYSLFILLSEGLLWNKTGARGDWRITAALVLDVLALGFTFLLLFGRPVMSMFVLN